MALFLKSGAEVSKDTYKALRSGNRAAKAQIPALREILNVRPHKRAYGFSLQERARVQL